MGWKYIIIRTKTHDIPVIFPDCLVHAEVADNISATSTIRRLGKESIVGAGDVGIMFWNCEGESETLKVKSRGSEDLEVLDSFEYGTRGFREDGEI